MTPEDIIDQIEEVRRRNNREWMKLLRIAQRVAPQETKEVLQAINANDKEIGDLLGQLAGGEEK